MSGLSLPEQLVEKEEQIKEMQELVGGVRAMLTDCVEDEVQQRIASLKSVSCLLVTRQVATNVHVIPDANWESPLMGIQVSDCQHCD